MDHITIEEADAVCLFDTMVSFPSSLFRLHALRAKGAGVPRAPIAQPGPGNRRLSTASNVWPANVHQLLLNGITSRGQLLNKRRLR